MTTLVLALRGAAAVGVLASLVGGIPQVVRIGLALAVGLWSAAMVGEAAAWPQLPGLTARIADASLWLVATRELVIGATIGVIAAMPLLAAATAGRLVERAAGRSGSSGGGALAGGPYGALFSVLAAAVFVGIDGHVAFVTAITDSFHDAPAVAVSEPRVVATLARLVPAAIQLAIPWLVTAAVVEIAAGVAGRLAARASGDGLIAALPPAALVMMTASLLGTFAVAIAALVQ